MLSWKVALISLVIAACATPSKQSKLSNLVGEGGTDTAEDKILDDLARTIYVNKIVPKTAQKWAEATAGQEQKQEVRTSTWVKMYPYTKPLLRARIAKNVEDKGYKDKWSPDKIKAEINRQFHAETARLTQSKQCFAFEIESGDRDALDLQYWHGQLKQGAKPLKLTFSKGSGFVITTRSTTLSGSHGYYHGYTTDHHTYYYYADACTSQPIDLAKAFTIVIDPRFEKDLAPMKTEWLAPDSK